MTCLGVARCGVAVSRFGPGAVIAAVYPGAVSTTGLVRDPVVSAERLEVLTGPYRGTGLVPRGRVADSGLRVWSMVDDVGVERVCVFELTALQLQVVSLLGPSAQLLVGAVAELCDDACRAVLGLSGVREGDTSLEAAAARVNGPVWQPWSSAPALRACHGVIAAGCCDEAVWELAAGLAPGWTLGVDELVAAAQSLSGVAVLQ